jgi:glycosyltransferase involved in cell wall biosynthesis
VKAVYRCVDAQIVLGECLRELFRDIIPSAHVFVVPNGKDVEFPPKKNRGDGFRVLFLANMMRTKGVLDALHCVRGVHEKSPHVEFVFAGAWNEADVRHEIEDFLAREKDLPITWIGEIHGQAKYRLLRAADVFLFPTYYPPEGHPWVIVEAMAAGLPIVSTDQGAIRESVLDGVNGFIVDKNNPADVAEAVLRISGSATLRERMGNASRRLYEDKFTEARMVERIRRCFENVLGVAG